MNLGRNSDRFDRNKKKNQNQDITDRALLKMLDKIQSELKAINQRVAHPNGTNEQEFKLLLKQFKTTHQGVNEEFSKTYEKIKLLEPRIAKIETKPQTNYMLIGQSGWIQFKPILILSIVMISTYFSVMLILNYDTEKDEIIEKYEPYKEFYDYMVYMEYYQEDMDDVKYLIDQLELIRNDDSVFVEKYAVLKDHWDISHGN